ncbi:class I SAM-dependent methyltransferase [Patescibacteria group bacterium]|nr:class I SAM-dependent methyltransferase [Patescibacteria group bacterium]
MSFEEIPKTESTPPIELVDKNRERVVETEAIKDLKDLGLDFDYLKDKLTLDVGAGLAEIAEVARKKGIKIISLDINPEMWTEEGTKLPDVPYVKASAERLPFDNEVFDLVISHAGPFSIIPSKEMVAGMIAEAKRVLRGGGELRFGPGNLNANIFTLEELFTPEEEESLPMEQIIDRISQKSLEFLKSIDPNITQEEIREPSHDFLAKHFYILRKPKPEVLKK